MVSTMHRLISITDNDRMKAPPPTGPLTSIVRRTREEGGVRALYVDVNHQRTRANSHYTPPIFA